MDCAGPDIERKKLPRVVHIVAMGDSTNFGSGWGAMPLSGQAARSAEEVRSATLRAGKAGVEGCSVAHARKFFELRIRPFSPDVTASVGWNDIHGLDPARAGEPTVCQEARAPSARFMTRRDEAGHADRCDRGYGQCGS